MTQQAPNWNPTAVATSIGWLDRATGEHLVAAVGLTPDEGAEGAVPNSPAWAKTYDYAADILNLTLPVITGSAVVGQDLTASSGTWRGVPTIFAYQWLRAGVDIDGATAATYTPTADDIGSELSVTVTATKRGSEGEATSVETAAVAAATAEAVPE